MADVAENNNFSALYDPYLYKLEQQAPKPHKIACSKRFPNTPEHYGDACHGPISREEGNSLVQSGPEGSYLIRESLRQPGTYTLVFILDGVVRNYRIYYNGLHFIDQKEYDSLEDLIADGLITLYVESRGREHIEAMSDAAPIYDDVNKIYGSAILDTTDGANNNGSINQLISPTKDGGYVPNGAAAAPSPEIQLPVTAMPTPAMLLPPPSNIVPKAHNFKVTTFKGPHWCLWCGNYMWGLVSQGVKCQDCGLNVHKGCQKKSEDRKDCIPSKKRIKNIFGCDLTVLCMAYSEKVPFVVKMCIEEIRTRDVQTEGLYRVSGFNDDIELVRENFERYTTEARIDSTFFLDINSITGALKLYLRCLPVPVIEFKAYHHLIDAMTMMDDACSSLVKKTIQGMEVCHRTTLQYIVCHLSEVAEQRSFNKMDCDNLGTVFGPTLMRSPDSESFKTLIELPMQKQLVSYLISNYSRVFTQPLPDNI